MEKLWKREFGMGDMSSTLDRVIPDVHKSKGAVQWLNGSEWNNQKKTGVSYARSNPWSRKHGATEKSKRLKIAEVAIEPPDDYMGFEKMA